MQKDKEPEAMVAEAPEEVIELSVPGPDGVEGAETLVELVLAAHEARAAEEEALPSRVDGVVIGRLVRIDASGDPRVAYAGCGHSEGVVARSMAALGDAHVGRDVALLFE